MTSSWKSISVRSQFQRDADAARDKVAAVAHPGRTFFCHPNRGERGLGVDGAVLEAHQIARRFAGSVAGEEATLDPAQLRRAVGQPHELPYRVERHLGIVRTGLDRQITAALVSDQLIAVEGGHVHQCVRAA
jgi:hypothetical protein